MDEPQTHVLTTKQSI